MVPVKKHLHMRKKLILLTACSLLGFLTPVSAALAEPGTLQDFKVSLTSSKVGTSSKPQWVGVNLNPFYPDTTLSGGPSEDWVATGAFLEVPPFATEYANLYFPKYMRFYASKFPTCKPITIIQEPDKCPRNSEIGRGGVALTNSQGQTYEKGNLARTDYVSGGVRYARSGDYTVGLEQLSVRLFNLGANKIALRTYNSTFNASLTEGILTNGLTSEEKKAGYGTKLRIAFARVLLEPLPGTLNQMASINSGLRKLTIRKSGRTYGFAGLVGCPKDRTLHFGYLGEYNIAGLEDANGNLRVGAKSTLLDRTTSCK